METVRRKKLTKTIQFVDVIKHSPWDGSTRLMIFKQIIHWLIDTRQRTSKNILKILKRGSVFVGLHRVSFQFWECRFTQICCAKT